MADTPDLIVHYLEYGQSLCLRSGLPYQWPPEHWFVTIHDGPKGLAAVTCPTCKAVLERKATA